MKRPLQTPASQPRVVVYSLTHGRGLQQSVSHHITIEPGEPGERQRDTQVAGKLNKKGRTFDSQKEINSSGHQLLAAEGHNLRGDILSTVVIESNGGMIFIPHLWTVMHPLCQYRKVGNFVHRLGCVCGEFYPIHFCVVFFFFSGEQQQINVRNVLYMPMTLWMKIQSRPLPARGCCIDIDRPSVKLRR